MDACLPVVSHDTDDHERREAQTVVAITQALAQRGLEVEPTLGHVLSLPARIMKRTLDLVGAALLFLAVLPLLLAAGLAVVATSKGSVLFAQERVGRGGRPFRMYKVRSMGVDNNDRQHREYVARHIRGEAGDHGGVFKLVQDSRITRVGRVLRRYSIDELPQLWNVLRGEMSLVGPRPALRHEVELYDDEALQRLVVQPGLTGLWQVSGRCRLSFAEMIALDVHYWQNWTLRADLWILLKTPFAALSGRGVA